MELTAHCPLCDYPLDPMDTTIVCRYCGRTNEHHNIMFNCDYCGKDLEKMTCPNCNKEFSVMLLIGSYTYKYKKLEPFLVPPVDNAEAVAFFNKIPEDIEFDLRWDDSPKTMMVIKLINNYPNYSMAQGLLLSLNIDMWEQLISRSEHDSLDPYLKEYVIGTISIEYGGNITGVKIDAKPFKL